MTAKIKPRGRAQARQGGVALILDIWRICLGLSCKPSHNPIVTGSCPPTRARPHWKLTTTLATGQPDNALSACSLANETMVENNLKNRLKNNLVNFTEPGKALHNNAEPQLSVPEFVVKARVRCGQSTGRLWSIHGVAVVNARCRSIQPVATCCGQSTAADTRAVRSCGQGVERLMAHDHR